MQKMQFFEEKNIQFTSQMFIIQKFEKNGMWCCAPSHGKWNKIIKYVLSVKLWEEIGFLQDPRKAYIFYAICFLYVSQKRSRNKLCLEPNDTYLLFRTFFSHVNIKQFFLSSDPLKWLRNTKTGRLHSRSGQHPNTGEAIFARYKSLCNI